MTRAPLDRARLADWMAAVGRAAHRPCRVLLTGGATAVLLGWRKATLDVDLSGEIDEILPHIPEMKRALGINIETAKPTDFVPSLPGESSRHRFIERVGKAEFFHFDPYAQAFSKIVRGFPKDLDDARRLLQEGWVDAGALARLVRDLPKDAYLRTPRLTRAAVEDVVVKFASSIPTRSSPSSRRRDPREARTPRPRLRP